MDDSGDVCWNFDGNRKVQTIRREPYSSPVNIKWDGELQGPCDLSIKFRLSHIKCVCWLCSFVLVNFLGVVVSRETGSNLKLGTNLIPPYNMDGTPA